MKSDIRNHGVPLSLILGIFLVLLSLTTFAGISAAEDLLESGINQYKAENYEEALQVLKEAKSQAPGSSVASFYLGLTYKQLGEYKDAAVHLKDAITLSPSVLDSYAELIECLYNGDELREASDWIAKAEQAGVTPARTAFLKGMVLSKQGKNEEAIAAYKKAKELDSTLTQSADFQIALLFAKDKKISQARESLKAVIDINPNSEFAAFAKEYGDAINRLTSSYKAWRITAGIAYQYDDNVVLKPSEIVDIPAVDDITGKRDSSIVGTFRLDYTPLLTGPWFLNAQYNMYTNNYFNTSSHDITTNSLSLTPGYNFNHGALTLLLNYTYAWVKERSYMGMFTAKPALNLIVKPGHIVQLSAGYSKREMLQNPLDEAEDRDSNIYTLAAAYIHTFAGDKGVFNLGYEYSKDNTDGRNWENTGNRIGAGILAPLTEKVSLSVSGEAFLQDYENTHTVFGVKRKDKTYTGSAAVMWEFMKNMYLDVEYSHTTADSNIAIYDYNRNIYTVGVQYNF